MIEQTRKDYIETRKRNRRVQIPPLSYWQKYAEMTDEEEFSRAVTDIMDVFGRFIIFLAIICIIALISYHFQIYWLPGAVAILYVGWWVYWGRR